jgi:antitoxin HigA-1
VPRPKNYPVRDPDRCPTHPGAVLREIVFPEIRVSKTAIAAAMQMSRTQLSLILGGKQLVTPDTAVRLAAAVGRSPRMWLNMQVSYDLWHAERRVDVSASLPWRLHRPPTVREFREARPGRSIRVGAGDRRLSTQLSQLRSLCHWMEWPRRR